MLSAIHVVYAALAGQYDVHGRSLQHNLVTLLTGFKTTYDAPDYQEPPGFSPHS